MDWLPVGVTLIFLLAVAIEDWRTSFMSSKKLYAFVGVGVLYWLWFLVSNHLAVELEGVGFIFLIAALIILACWFLEKWSILGEGDGWVLAGIYLYYLFFRFKFSFDYKSKHG